MYGESHWDKWKLFFNTEIKCCVVGTGSYSSTLCLRMNTHLTWLYRKLLSMMGKRGAMVVNSLWGNKLQCK